jgi:polyhydroxyalkanoate synthesis regulator phasin
VNRVINRLEDEVESLVKRLVKQGERSRKDLKKNFDDILKKVRAGKIMARANETREEIEKDVRRVAEEVLGTVKDVESIINREKMAGILSNARDSMENLVEVLRENGLVLQAKQTVANTRREVLGFFSIPTQGDVEKLERKIVNLEKRLSNLTRKAA